MFFLFYDFGVWCFWWVKIVVVLWLVLLVLFGVGVVVLYGDYDDFFIIFGVFF